MQALTSFLRQYSNAPMLLVAPALPFVVWSFKSFEDDFLWEQLPFNEIANIVLSPERLI